MLREKSASCATMKRNAFSSYHTIDSTQTKTEKHCLRERTSDALHGFAESCTQAKLVRVTSLHKHRKHSELQKVARHAHSAANGSQLAGVYSRQPFALRQFGRNFTERSRDSVHRLCRRPSGRNGSPLTAPYEPLSRGSHNVLHNSGRGFLIRRNFLHVRFV